MTEEVRGLIDRVTGHPGPVLSAYLSVNPAYVENRDRAYVVRLKVAMKERGVPQDLAARVMEFFEREHPRAHTLVIFAASDGLFEAYGLPVDLPEVVRWGEPAVAPLMLALEEHERYGVVLVDRERLRFFTTFLGGVEEVVESENRLDTAGWRELNLAPSTGLPRGGSAKDDFDDRVEANVRRFYREMADAVRHEARKMGVKRLILAGTRERVAEFRDMLPREVRETVVGEVPVPAGAPESEILERVSEARERAAREREAELMNAARERGVHGLKETVEALQEGRVYQVLVLWDLEEEVRWSDAEGMVRFDGGDPSYPESETRPRPLMDVLVDLARARGARIEFVRGDNEVAKALREECGGICGLTRFSVP